MNFIRTLLLTAALSFAPLAANATVVQFTGSPATTFAGGTFSHHLSGMWSDGFYGWGNSAYNGFGQNNEFLLFDAPVQFNSASFQQNWGVQTLTVSLFNVNNALLTQQTLGSLNNHYQSLTFNTNGVSKAMFTFTGGSNVYGDGRTAAWYNVSDITFSANQEVPEPASIALFGLAMFGAAAASRRRRKSV